MQAKCNCREGISAALARISLPDADRRIAEDSLRNGELIADLIIGAAGAVSCAIHRVKRALRTPARAADRRDMTMPSPTQAGK